MRTYDTRLILLIGLVIWCMFLWKALFMFSDLMGWV